MNSKKTVSKLIRYLTEQSNLRRDFKNAGRKKPRDIGSLIIQKADEIKESAPTKWIRTDSPEYKKLLADKQK